MQPAERTLVFVLGFLSMLAVSPLWAEPSERTAEATIVAMIQASPQSATNPVGTDHTVTATATDSISGNPLVGYDVTLDVTSGPNVGESQAGITDANGQATFTYTDAGGPGQDSIEVCLSFSAPLGNGRPPLGQPPLDCDTVTKDWVNQTPTPTPTSTASPTTTPAPTATRTSMPSPTSAPAQLPATGSGTGGTSLPWLIVAGTALAALVCAGGAAALRRRI